MASAGVTTTFSEFVDGGRGKNQPEHRSISIRLNKEARLATDIRGFQRDWFLAWLRSFHRTIVRR